MPVIINNNVNNNLIVKNKDVRSESVDSFSSTIDVHASFEKSKQTQTSCVNDFLASDDNNVPPHFDLCLPAKDQDDRLLHIRSTISSIIILNNSTSSPKVQNLLDAYKGHLVDIGEHLLEGLRTAAPSSLAARVGDYNENLFYEMRDCDQDIGSIIQGQGQGHESSNSNRASDNCGLDSLIQQDIISFEQSIRESLQQRKTKNVTYRGSFMQTESTMYQPAHVDYDYPILQTYGKRLFLAFFPLTEEGAFLQLWQDPKSKSEISSSKEDNEDEDGDGDDDDECSTSEGTVVHIPYGKMLIVPSDTIHGGGFKRGAGGNLRFHLYIAVEEEEEEEKGDSTSTNDNDTKEGCEEKTLDEIDLLHHPMNKYTEQHDRRRELCERFVDARGLDGLLGVFFDV